MARRAKKPSATRLNPVKTSGASQYSFTNTGTFSAYLAHHKQVGIETLLDLLRNWVESLMTWLVIGIAFSLPLILMILLNNIDEFGDDWQGTPKLSIYLVSQIEEEAAFTLLNNINAMQEVVSARYISADDALAEFESNTSFNDVLAALPFNPLPAVIEVEPAAVPQATLKLWAEKMVLNNDVESVSLDIEWIERLLAFLALGQRFVNVLAMFLGFGVILAIGNTIRLAIENRRTEIEVVKLVGGTNSFVRRPFLYLGLWYGLGGAFLAWFMVQMSLLILAAPIERLLHAYQDEFVLIGLGPLATSILLLSGILLGLLGAGLAVSRHLHRIEPK